MNPVGIAAIAFLVGAGGASAVWSTMKHDPPKAASTRVERDVPDESALAKANANLTEQLHECDRRIAELRSSAGEPVAAVAPSAPEQPRGRGRDRERDGGGGRRGFGEPTKEDWERMAELGNVRVRIPCVRDKPWTPNERTVQRLGLAPNDVEALKEVYAESNKRVMAEVKPLCAKVLGTAAAAEQAGASACMDAINNSARRGGAEANAATKQALTRVAEVQAGKREAPAAGADTAPIEALSLALAKESKNFESDLAKRLGPDEAKRLASSPGMCMDMKNFRSSDD